MTDLPRYSRDRFVNRDEEIKLVVERALRLHQGLDQRQRVIIFTGERGTGKTWLLRYLEETLRELGSRESKFLHDLEERLGLEGGKLTKARPVDVLRLDLTEFWEQEPSIVVMSILKKATQEVWGADDLPGGLPSEMARAFMDRLQPRLGESPLVVLIDSVYESPWALLAELESYFIAPLANKPHVLLVMTGRGKPYPWRTPGIRLNVEIWPLKGFEKINYIKEQVRKQIDGQPRLTPAEIKNWGDGVPLVNYLLGKYGEKGLDDAIELMLEPVDEADRSRVREVVEAICVLQAFEEERIQGMLSAYKETPADQKEAGEALRLLLKWSLARHQPEKGGYVLDELIRTLAERYLEKEQPEVWKRLHCAAYRLYEEWIEQYPRAAELWRTEKEYHKRRLCEKGIDLKTCPPAAPQQQKERPVGTRACEEEGEDG